MDRAGPSKMAYQRDGREKGRFKMPEAEKKATGYDKYVDWKLFIVPVALFILILMLPTPYGMKDVGTEYKVGPKAVINFITHELFGKESQDADQWELIAAQIMEKNLQMGALTKVRFLKRDLRWCRKYKIKAEEKTAINGQWVQVPIDDFLSTMLNRFSPLPIIAEDLGIITPDVKEVMSRFNVPGMKVLLFAFGDDDPNHPYLPHTYGNCCVVYTGTHDTNTLRGWFEKETRPEEKKKIFRYLGRKLPVKDIHWEFVRLALMSVAEVAIFPLQDILGLGEEARMNQPATRKGNWKWQLEPDQLTPDLSQRLGEMTRTYGRMTDSVSRG